MPELVLHEVRFGRAVGGRGCSTLASSGNSWTHLSIESKLEASASDVSLPHCFVARCQSFCVNGPFCERALPSGPFQQKLSSRRDNVDPGCSWERIAEEDTVGFSLRISRPKFSKREKDTQRGVTRPKDSVRHQPSGSFLWKRTLVHSRPSIFLLVSSSWSLVLSESVGM